MGKKKITVPVCLVRIVMIAILPGLLSCSPNHSAEPYHNSTLTGFKAPAIIEAGSPYVVKLDTCPQPQIIPIRLKDSSQFELITPFWKRKLNMRPPPVNQAGFFITMPKFNNEEGLQAHSVFSSYQDRSGNLWFGTHGGGVTRYDGKSSVTFTGLGCNDVRVIVEDTIGNIWFGMGGCGVVKYDGRSITSYTKAQGLIDNEVRSLAFDKNGTLWIGTDGFGVSSFDGKHFTSYTTANGLLHNIIMGITVDKTGNVWFATDGGVNFYDGHSFHSVTPADGLASNFVRSILCDNDGNMWFATNNGVSKYNGHSFRNYTTADGLVSNNVTCLAKDEAGNIWMGTYGWGVSKFDGHSFENFTKKNGLSTNFIKTITVDTNGNVWIGAEGGGVTCYEGSIVTSYSVDQGLFNHYITSIAEDKQGNIWFGPNDGGICKYDGKTFTNFTWYQGFPQNRVNEIFRDTKNNMWFCTSSGISKYNGKSFTNFNTRHGIRSNEVQCAAEDKEGNIWFGMENGGISKFTGTSFINYTTAQGLASNNVRKIIIDSAGIFWIATYGGGISRFDGKTFMNLGKAQGMTEDFLLSMLLDSKGNLWAGTGNGGVSILRNEVREKLSPEVSELPTKLFERFTTAEGLANNVVYDIVEDRQKNIIIGTNYGLTVVKKMIALGKSIISYDIEYYNQKSGYAIPDMNGKAMYVDSKGYIWGGTGNDLIRFDYSAVRKNAKPLPVAIQGIKINNESPGWYYLHYKRTHPVDTAKTYVSTAVEVEETINYGTPKREQFRDSMYKKFKSLRFDSVTPFNPLPQNLVLSSKYNNVTIEFAALKASKPKLVKYQYMLEGYDRDWSPITDQSRASFGNINEGSYTFKVKALSPDGIWSEPVSYNFRVMAPWYRTIWAYIFYLAAFLFTLYTFYRNRIRGMEKKEAARLQTVIATQEEERKRMSRDLHDDVGTKLSALKLFLSSLRSNADMRDYAQVDTLAANSEKLINETIKDVREMLLNLSPGILEEFGFISAIQGLVTKINQTGVIHFELSTFGFQNRLRNEYELALYRIIQELINNVLKHAEAKYVSLQIGYREGNIIIMMEDDGKGFEINEHRDGYGLKNLDTRTKLLNGTMNIDSHIGTGTSVSIEIPYKL